MDGHGDPGQDGLPPALELRILGPLEAWLGDQQVALGGQRQRSVLACLLLEPGRAVSSDRIADAVWDGHPPNGVQTTLQTYVFHLRDALEPTRVKGAGSGVITTVPGGYRLEVAALTVDAVRFEELVAAGRSHLAADPAEASALLKQALALWRGDVLADLAMDGFVTPVATRLEELRGAATELWVEAEMALGHDVLSTLDDLVTRYPLREHLAAMRMLTLYRAGRQADALAAYRELRQTLDDELGIQPSAEVESLHRRVLQQDPSLDLARPAIPDVASTTTSPTPEPAAPTVGGPNGSRWHGRFTRRGWAAVTAVVLVAVTALAGLVLSMRRADVTPLPPNSVGPVDTRGLLGDAVRLTSAPADLVAAGDAIWAVQGDTDALVRIDPRDRRVTQTVPGVGRLPQAVAAWGEDLWLVAFGEKVLTRVDLRTAKVVHKITVGTDPVAVVAGPNGVWVANSGDNTVTHIDPATEQVDAPIFVGDGPDALALDGGSLWVANGRSGTVSQLDTRTGKRVAADIRVDAGPAALAVTATDVWVANQGGQTVSRISTSTRQVKRIEVGDGPSSVAVVDAQVWVTNRDSGTVSRIDTRTNDVMTLDLKSAATAVINVDGQLWVAAGAHASPEHRGGTLVWSGSYFLPTVDPAYAYFPPNQVLLRPVYDGLVAFRMGSGRSSLGLVPDLATYLPEPTDGGKSYVFTLRPGVRYSNGAPVQATDFVRGMRRALQKEAANPGLLRAIVGATECTEAAQPGKECDLSNGLEADDPTGRVTIRLTKPDPELLEKLSVLLYPVPAGTPVTNQEWKPVPGTGPYMVTSAGPSGVTLDRNPYFQQWSSAAQPDGYPDTIKLRLVESEAQSIADVLGGTAAGAFTDDPLPLSITSRPAYFHSFELLDLQVLYPNATVPPFDDKRVRQALNYAVDRRANGVLRGPEGEYATPTCQLVPPGIPGYRPYCPYQKGPADGPYQGPDIDKARALVAASGTVNVPIVVRYRPFPTFKDTAEYAATVLRELGYQVSVEPVDFGAPAAVTDTYQLQVRLGWLPDYPLPGSYYDGLVACGEVTLTYYCNPTIHALVSRARSIRLTDPAESLELWSQADRLLTDEAALVPLINRVGAIVVRPELGNVMTRSGYGPLIDQIWVK